MKPMFNLLTVLALATFRRCDLLPVVADTAHRNMLEMSMAEVMADVSDGKWTCGNNTCSCCVKLNISRAELVDELCTKVSGLKDKMYIELEVTYDGETIFKREERVENPLPISLKVKEMKKTASASIKFSFLRIQDKKVEACAELEVFVMGLLIGWENMGCFIIPYPEQAGLEKAKQKTLPEFVFLGRVKRIIKLKQILLETKEEITV